VVALQELWCWKTGIFPPCFLRAIGLLEFIPYIGRFFSALFQLLSILLGVIPILKCLPFKYNPKSRFIHKMRRHLPYAYRDANIPNFRAKFMDNGLCTLTNKPATRWGFQGYIHDACDDNLANKGFLWCYFEAQRLLIINTHLQAAGAGLERLHQIKEVKQWLEIHWEDKGLVSKIIIMGDFNVDMESHPKRVEYRKHHNLDNNDHSLIDLHNGHGHNGHSNGLLLVPSDADHDTDDTGGGLEEEKQDVVMATDETPRESEETITGINDLEILEELGDDPLTCLPSVGCKESLADNLRKLNLRQESGTKTKFVKKAYINIPYHLGPEFRKLNRYEPTFKRADYNIDHIFTNFECKGIRNQMLALGRYKLSDHRLIVSEFTAD